MGVNRFTLRLKELESAFSRLKEAYLKTKESKMDEKKLDDYPFFRDSSIQRFEFTVELFWKCIKDYLEVKEGVLCESPKKCIKKFGKIKQLSEEEILKLLQMIDDRNLTSHLYREQLAEELFAKLQEYLLLLEKLIKLLKEA